MSKIVCKYVALANLISSGPKYFYQLCMLLYTLS